MTDHPFDALRLRCANEPLGVRTAVRRAQWDANDLHAVIPEDFIELGSELLVAIDDEVRATAKKAVIESDPLERRLFHEGRSWPRRRTDDLYASALQAQREEHVVGDETSRSPHLRREEVCRGERSPVSLEELRPDRLRSLLGCRLDSMGSKDSFHRVERHLATNVRQSALYSPVAPTRTLVGHPDDEILDRFHDARSPGSFPIERPLPSDQLAVPTQDRVWRDDRRDLERATFDRASDP